MSGTDERFDVLIVGARCAGAVLARLLADAGLSVALLDAASLPSDQPSSTHLIQPPGMRELDAHGLGEEVRRASPEMRAMRLSFDGIEARLSFGPGRTAHCLPRTQLDALLLDAALAAGAELRQQTRVIELARDDCGRVCGVLASRAGESPQRIGADLVVGADGRNSTVAKLVDAEEYLGYDGPRSAYWAYWPTPAGWNLDEFHSSFTGTSARGIFPTTRDRLLIATIPLVEQARGWRRDHTASYVADIRAYPQVADALADAQPIGRVRGVFRSRYFFRTSGGPGWALIGDAGHHKEFVAGLGISDAFRDARMLAEAIGAGGPDSPQVQSWWRDRDAERLGLYNWGRELGNGNPVDAVQRLVATRLSSWSPIEGRYGRVISGELSPTQLVPLPVVLRWVLADVLRGNLAVLPSLFSTARELVRDRRLASADLGPPTLPIG